MTDLSAVLRECLEHGDVHRLRSIWSQVCPHLPQPKNRDEATVSLHQARTAAKSVSQGKRQYSHVWLRERGYKSDLPDDLKTKSEQLGRPVIVEATGVSVIVMGGGRALLERALETQTVMENSVMETLGDDITDPVIIKARMMEARERVRRM